jgi:chromosome segregation ATPase
LLRNSFLRKVAPSERCEMADIPSVVDVIVDPEKDSIIDAKKGNHPKQHPTLSFVCDDEEQFGIELNLEELPYMISSSRSSNKEKDEPEIFDFTSSPGFKEEPSPEGIVASGENSEFDKPIQADIISKEQNLFVEEPTIEDNLGSEKTVVTNELVHEEKNASEENFCDDKVNDLDQTKEEEIESFSPTSKIVEDHVVVQNEPKVSEQVDSETESFSNQPQEEIQSPSPTSTNIEDPIAIHNEIKVYGQDDTQTESFSNQPQEETECSVERAEEHLIAPQVESSSTNKKEEPVAVDEPKNVDEEQNASANKKEEPVAVDEPKKVDEEQNASCSTVVEQLKNVDEGQHATYYTTTVVEVTPGTKDEMNLVLEQLDDEQGKDISYSSNFISPEAVAHPLPQNEDKNISFNSTTVVFQEEEVEEVAVSERQIVDYDKNPSALYKALQQKDWKLAMDLVDQNPDEVFTWIIRKDKEGMTRWCLLPIHAALIFKAPMHVIVKLISKYPESGLCKDDQGMVPLHLAFRHGASDSILYEILSSCPDAIDVKDDKGRTPLALHSTYVARANAQGSPTNGADNNTQKMRPSAFERYVTVAADRARKSTKSKLEAYYVSKLKTLHDEHTEQLENLRKLASDEFSASRERIKELEKKKRILESNLNDKKKEAENLSKQNHANKLAISNVETLLQEVTTSKHEEKVAFLQKISQLESEITEIKKIHGDEVKSLEEKAVASEINIAELISKCHAAEDEVSVLKKTTAELEAKGEELKSFLEERLAKYEDLSKKYESLCESEKSLRVTLMEHEQSLDITTKALRDSDALLSQMNTTILELRSDIVTKTTKVQTLKEEIEKLSVENNELKEKADVMEHKNRELSNTNEELKMKYHLQCCENLGLKEQVSELSTDIALNTENLKQSEEALNELKLSMENIKVQFKTKTEEEESLKALLIEKEFEFDQYKSSAEEEIQRLSQDLGNQVMRTSERELQFNDLEQTFSKLQRKFEAKCKEAAALDAELEETRAQNLEELEQKEVELNRMMASLSDYNIKFQEIAKSSEVLVGEFKAKCEEEAELRFQLEQVQSEFEEMVALKEKEFESLKEKYEALEIEALDLKGVVLKLEEEQAASMTLMAELSQNLSISQDEITKLERALRESEETMKFAVGVTQAKEQEYEEKIAGLERQGTAISDRNKVLEKCIVELEEQVKVLREEGEAKDIVSKQKIVDAERNLKDITDKIEEVTASSADKIDELKAKISEKTKENLRHIEKNNLLEEVTSQMRKRAMELEEEKLRNESQLNEKLAILEEEHQWLQHRLVELESSKEKEIEEISHKAAEKQSKLDRELKHLQLVNEKKTEMNTTLQRQLRDMSSHMQQLTDNLLRLSAQHEKFVEKATDSGISFDGLKV